MNYVKIMIVKRDKREVEQLVSIVKSIPGYEVSGICDSGQEAVKKILEREPDVVIMDEVLPGKDILEITEEIMHYKNLKNTRILLCGSKTHKEYLDFIYYKIADRLVLRILDVPYDERKIREIIEDVMKAKRNDNYQKLVETGSDGNMLEAVVTDIIHEIGVPAHIKGSVSSQCDPDGSSRYGHPEFNYKAVVPIDCRGIWNDSLQSGTCDPSCNRGCLG